MFTISANISFLTIESPVLKKKKKKKKRKNDKAQECNV